MKYFKLIFLTAFTIVSVLFITSCDKQLDELQPINEYNISFLGKKLENPYSVDNMRNAFENIKGNFNKSVDINPSHYYIRYLPKNEEELDLIKSDTLVEWYSYPLDYEINENTDKTSYHDPTVPKNQPTWQYSAIPVENPIFTQVQYEILEELFIPEELDSKSLDEAFIDALVDEALRITNNLSEEEILNNTKASRWRPAGTIRVWDDIGIAPSKLSYFGTNNSNHVPLRGAKVRARRWFRTYTGFTNYRGYFSCNGRFRRAANYSIKWERAYWDIRNRNWGQVYYNGPKKKGNWNLTITGGKSLRYATIHRAAYRYHYEITGLKRPNVWHKLKIGYFDSSGTGVNWGNIPYWVVPNIRIYGKDTNGNYRDTDVIYSTTTHELGHASHMELMGGLVQYAQVSKIIYESWANCIEWHITKIEYNYLGNSDYDLPPNNIDNMQSWDDTDSHDYTPLFIDIIDDYNQHNISSLRPDDRIKRRGTPRDIETWIVKNTYGLSSLRSNLKSSNTIWGTDAEIDIYMDYYNGF